MRRDGSAPRQRGRAHVERPAGRRIRRARGARDAFRTEPGRGPASPAAPPAPGRGDLMTTRDIHIHVEKTPAPGFGLVAMRTRITEAIGLVPDLPKTVGTGCGRRRPIAMT